MGSRAHLALKPSWYSAGMTDWLRTIRIAIYTGLFATPFLALIVANGLYFPFITGKNFTFRILVEIIFALWVILALYDATYRPRRSLALILGGLFVLSIGVSTVLAENPVKAFWSNFERMEGYITILHLAMYVTVMTSVLKTEELWRRFFNCSLIAAGIVALYALLQLGGFFAISQSAIRIDATFGNATYFAVFMLIHAFVALYALVHWAGQSRVWLSVYGACFVVFSILVFYSSTRGSILGLLGGLTFAGLLAAVTAGGRARYIGIGIVGVILVLTAAFFSIKDTPFVRTHPVLERLASISLEAGNTRFAIWQMALKGAAERPVFGWGQEGFNHLFNKYYESKLVTQEPWFDRAHNVVLDWLVAGGALGMLLYLSLYAVLVYYLWRPGSPFEMSERAVFTGLLAGYAFHNIFVFDNLMSYVMFMILFSYITVRAVPDREWGTALPESSAQIAVPAVVVLACAMVYFVNIPGYAAASGIIQGLSPQPAGIQKNLEYFKDSSQGSGLGLQEVGEQFIQFALQARFANVGDEQFKLDAANAARETFLRVLEQAPNDARLLVFYGSFLRQYGDLQGARAELAKAEAVSPLKQSILLERGMLELTDRQFDTALQYFAKVYETAPQFGRVHIMYPSAAILAGKQALADEIMLKEFGTTEPDDATIIQAYMGVKNYDKALRMASARVTADPTSVDKRKFLAGIYLELKNTNAAIATLRDAIAVSPDFKAEGESYISRIQSGELK